MLNTMKSIWKAWKHLAHGIITAQNTILLLVVFLFGVAPAAILARLTHKPLLDRGLTGSDTKTDWLDLPQTTRDMDWAQRPF